MKFISLIVVATLSFAGCSTVTGVAERFGLNPRSADAVDDVQAPVDPFIKDQPAIEAAVLTPATAAPAPSAAAQTAEALDTTTAAQRAAASAPATTGVRKLGTTIVSLGSPAEPGLWLKTPLVQAEAQGRVTNPANGKSSLVTLIPIDGPATGGSRMSLSALRLIEASLTDLTEVEVSVEG